MRSYQQIIDVLDRQGSAHVLTWTRGPFQGRKFLLGEKNMEISDRPYSEEVAGELESLLEEFSGGASAWTRPDEWNYEKDGHECFVENLQSKPRLFLLGSGHVGTALSKIVCDLDFRLIVLDERPDFADPDRFPFAHQVLAGDYLELLAGFDERISDWFVIMTPGHARDRECAEAILKRKSSYVGMIGSRVKVAKTKKALEERGISRDRLDRLHAPIGLPIGGRTPAEIAVSIAAELVQIRNSSAVAHFDETILSALRQEETAGPLMMVTIIKKQGSGPRDPGTRMLVSSQGKLLAGTIGGGALEMAALAHVREMFDRKLSFELQSYDLTDSQAAELGMICGGNNRVMFEVF